jgi:hypothetical protein
MPRLIRLTPELRSDFVAYLDGELDEQATERIETVLAQSGVARKDVECLARTYELLDVLPRFEADGTFTERTMESLRLREQGPHEWFSQWQAAARGGVSVLGWMLALLMVIGVTFLVSHRWPRSEADVLVRELPLIEQLDAYSEVGSVEFLERLSAQQTMLEEMSAEGRGGGHRP